MFRQGSLVLASATTLAAWMACGGLGQATALDDSGDAAAAALIVLPGARDLHRSSRQGARSIRYRIEAEFPAAGPIVDVVKRLKRRGWIPLGEDPLNALAATSLLRGWTSFVDASGTTPVRIYNWWSEWTNLGGDHVSYGFRYEAPEHRGSALRSLSVAAGFYPAPLARQLKEEATRAVEVFATTHRAEAAARPDDGRVRTMLPARAGDAFLVSGPAGEAAVRITGTSGEQVAYRWRFRGPAGSESSGSLAEASTITAGPFRLFWLPRSPLASMGEKEAAVGYLAGVDVIPIPGEQFASLDLGQAHVLATLVPERNRRLAEAASVRAEGDVRRDAILEAGKSTRLDSGRALLVQGPKGAGVIEIVHPGAESVKYLWRFRASTGSADASGEAEASERPFPELRVGPYLLQWQARSISDSDETGARAAGWSADVKYLPEELSLATIPAGDATGVDLAAVSALRISP